MTYNIKIKTNNPKNNIKQPHFYILNKGLNSGKPLTSACPNCFIIIVDTYELKEDLYWLCYGLWQAKAYYMYLRGSVIPFIIISEFKKVLFQACNKIQQEQKQFKKTIKALQSLQSKREEYLRNIALIDNLKEVVMQAYIKP